ncbi:sodium leak channel non-selective protein [Acrasis kona]|uniref:Sodium leak channel non-selective protein n=1 Tax=Acrasis kona TaxID=1008807 RepID=A0AAW2ZIG0_9EUKA
MHNQSEKVNDQRKVRKAKKNKPTPQVTEEVRKVTNLWAQSLKAEIRRSKDDEDEDVRIILEAIQDFLKKNHSQTPENFDLGAKQLFGDNYKNYAQRRISWKEFVVVELKWKPLEAKPLDSIEQPAKKCEPVNFKKNLNIKVQKEKKQPVGQPQKQSEEEQKQQPITDQQSVGEKEQLGHEQVTVTPGADLSNLVQSLINDVRKMEAQRAEDQTRMNKMEIQRAEDQIRINKLEVRVSEVERLLAQTTLFLPQV